jgi:hypothetical protein
LLAADELKAHRSVTHGNQFLVYRLQLFPDVERQAFCCLHSFRNILGLFRFQWATLKSAAKQTLPGPIIHGNVGKRNRYDGSNKKSVEEDIVTFLTELGRNRGESYATRFVRERTSVGLRKDEEGLIELPSCLSKRGLYKQFCFERGHVLVASAKGNFGCMDDFSPRPYDEDFWPEGSVTLPVVPWSTFGKVWEERLPKLRIRRKCEDTCPECFLIKNRFRYREARRDNINSDCSSVDSETDSGDYSDEDLIIKANAHVEQAQSQCAYVNELKVEAEKEKDKEHHDRRFVLLCLQVCRFYYYNCLNLTLFFFSYCLCADFAQNMDVPHFGEEQPADIYYFSPLTVNVFGCTDLSSSPTLMKAYGYTEAEGNKGSNNVASLLFRVLQDFGWLIDGETGKKLTIIMDNCGGQNKNNNVLRLALYLVELRYFKLVQFVFFVRGHTKNDCDRLFNQLKLRWHKINTYTMSQMVECLNMQPNVTFVEVKSDTFKDYGSVLDKLYKPFKNGTIQQHHIFLVQDTQPTVMIMKACNSDDEIYRYEFNNKVNNRADVLRTTQPTILPRPGIKPIKQVELYKKWRPFVPAQFRDEICPRPSDEVLNSVKNDRNSKARARTARRRVES